MSLQLSGDDVGDHLGVEIGDGINGNDFTIGFRMQLLSLPTGVGGDDYATLIYTVGSTHNVIVAILPDGTLVLRHLISGIDQGGGPLIGSTSLSAGVNYAIYLVFDDDSDDLYLYINGSLELSMSTDVFVSDMGLFGAGGLLPGKVRVQAVKMWGNRALTAGEIATEIPSILAVSTTSCIGDWDFEDASSPWSADVNSNTLSDQTNSNITYYADDLEVDLGGGSDLEADPGALALSAPDTGFVVSGTVDPGALQLEGADVSFGAAAQVVADPGELALAGAALTFTQSVPLEPGAIGLTPASIAVSIMLPTDPGAIGLAGADVTFSTNVALLEADPGALGVAGADVVFTKNFNARPSSLDLLGASVAFAPSIQAEPGSLALAGQDVIFDSGALNAEPGELNLTGADVSLNEGGQGNGRIYFSEFSVAPLTGGGL